jgi:hypothetical protein
VALIPDQGPVQQLTAADLHPPLHDQIHAGHPDAAEHDLDTRINQDGVEQFGELPVSVPVGFQNSATSADLGFYAAGSYSLIRLPRIGRRWIRSRERSATG